MPRELFLTLLLLASSLVESAKIRTIINISQKVLSRLCKVSIIKQKKFEKIVIKISKSTKLREMIELVQFLWTKAMELTTMMDGH